jgi:hypothetical protein
MKIKTNKVYSISELSTVLTNQFPQYKISVDKNPVLGFEYGMVKKSGLVAAIYRVKDGQINVYAGIPSALVRFVFFLLVILLGVIIPLIVYMIVSGKIVSEVGNYISAVVNSGQDLSSISPSLSNSGDQLNNAINVQAQANEIPPLVKWASIAGLALTGFFVLRTLVTVPGYYLSDSYILIPLLMNILAVVGLIFTTMGKKLGFFIFVAAIFLKLIIPFALYGGLGIFGIGYLFLIIDLAIIVILAVNLKYLK